MRTMKKKTAEIGRETMPRVKKEITAFLTSEEAKITSKSLLKGSLTLFCLGIMTEHALATHNSHSNYGSDHYNTTGHGNAATHANGDANHSSIAPHHSATPHSSDTDLGVGHANGHASGGLSESVTLGALHNDATAGFGKHSAGTGHYNLPGLVNTHVNVAGTGHADTAPHSSTAIHSSTGHHVNASNTNNWAQHYSMHASGADGHSSHGSHGQW